MQRTAQAADQVGPALKLANGLHAVHQRVLHRRVLPGGVAAGDVDVAGGELAVEVGFDRGGVVVVDHVGAVDQDGEHGVDVVGAVDRAHGGQVGDRFLDHPALVAAGLVGDLDVDALAAGRHHGVG